MESVRRFILTSSAEQFREISKLMETREIDLGFNIYANGKIYGIFHKTTNVLAYVGMTICPLPIRWSEHKYTFRSKPNIRWSRYVSDHGGADNFEIRLLEAYPCRNLTELLDQENHYINLLNPVCNIIRPICQAQIEKQIDARRVEQASAPPILAEEHQCKKCGEILSSKQALERHESRKTPCKAPLYRCQCGVGFSQLKNLNSHKRFHCKGLKPSLN